MDTNEVINFANEVVNAAASVSRKGAEEKVEMKRTVNGKELTVVINGSENESRISVNGKDVGYHLKKGDRKTTMLSILINVIEKEVMPEEIKTLYDVTEYWDVISNEIESYVYEALANGAEYHKSKWIWDRIEDFEKDLSELKHKIYDLYDDKEAV